jgi:hypothetical protein
MDSSDQNTQNYYNLPMNNLPIDQTGNSSAPQQIPNNNNNNENNQHTLINNVGVFNPNLNTLHISTITTTPAPQNEFYLLYQMMHVSITLYISMPNYTH